MIIYNHKRKVAEINEDWTAADITDDDFRSLWNNWQHNGLVVLVPVDTNELVECAIKVYPSTQASGYFRNALARNAYTIK